MEMRSRPGSGATGIDSTRLSVNGQNRRTSSPCSFHNSNHGFSEFQRACEVAPARSQSTTPSAVMARRCRISARSCRNSESSGRAIVSAT